MMSPGELIGFVFFALFTCAMMGFLFAGKAAKDPKTRSTMVKVGGTVAKTIGNAAMGAILKKFKK